jgi:hypothetical protein
MLVACLSRKSKFMLVSELEIEIYISSTVLNMVHDKIINVA